jgi:hypothetical protein
LLGSPLQIIRFSLAISSTIGSGVGGFLYQLKRNKHPWDLPGHAVLLEQLAMVA